MENYISEKQKNSIIDIMKSMKPMDLLWFKDFDPNERDYILFLIQNQHGGKFETNGTHSRPETITRFRRLSDRIITSSIFKP